MSLRRWALMMVCVLGGGSPAPAVNYYVNDGVADASDCWTSQPGTNSNDGLTPSTPKATVQAILDAYTLVGGDTIYVDSGSYTLSSTLNWTSADTGSSNSFITLQGCTNAWGPTSRLLQPTNALAVVRLFSGANWIRLSDLHIGHVQNNPPAFSRGLQIAGNSCRLNRLVLSNSYDGIFVDGASGLRVESTVILRQQYGAFIQTSAGQTTEVINCTFHVDREALSGGAPIVCVTNCVMRSEGNALFLINIANLRSDHNLLQPRAGRPIATTPGGVELHTVADVQKVYGQERRSARIDPLFANPAAGNYRLQSVAGRWNGTGHVADAVSSLGIDFGAPSSAFGAEPPPNGGRNNVGAYGNTFQASLSPSSPFIYLLNYRGAETLEIGNVLSWHASGIATSQTVQVSFSPDAGLNWFPLASGVPVQSGLYTFTNNFASTSFARWRVHLESNPSVQDVSPSNFVFRNGPFIYYVNDGSQNGDVYTGAMGNDSHLGILPSAPKRTLAGVVNAYTLGAGDIVYVDTGEYTQSSPPLFTSLDSGTNGQPLIIRGSPAGTVLTGVSPAAGLGVEALNVSGARSIQFENLQVRQMSRIHVSSSSNISFRNISALSNRLSGFTLENSRGITLENCVAYRGAGDGVSLSGSSTAVVQNCVFWNNAGSAIRVGVSGRAAVSNSVLASSMPLAYLYHVDSTASIQADYNNLYRQGDALVAYVNSLGRNLDSHGAWSTATAQDKLSLSVDPLFADPEAGDFHLKTETFRGRYDPKLRVFVTDPVTSDLIDAGARAGAFTNEPGLNGGRINIGAFGNTQEASQGRMTPWLAIGSLNQGGMTLGTTTLHWVASPVLSNAADLVRVEVSLDGGGGWTTLTSSVRADAEAILWNTTLTPNTPAGLWRVSLVATPSVADVSESFFSVRNGGPLQFYVNDASTNEDVYVSQPGAATNWLASTSRPLDGLERLLALYDVEPGDRIWVDTGAYTSSVPIRFGRRASGASATQRVVVAGSPVGSGTGSRIVLVGSGAPLRADHAQWLSFTNLTLRGGQDAMQVENSQDLVFEHLRGESSAGSGIALTYSTNVTLLRCVLASNALYGINSFSNSALRIDRSLSLSNQVAALLVDGGSGIAVSNSVLISRGDGSSAYLTSNSPPIAANFNNVLAVEGSVAAKIQGRVYRSVTDWSAATSNDTRSLSHEPLFAGASAGDYHLLSQAGRYSPTGLVMDAATSPMIDAGDPAANVPLEPTPNGGRLNIGLYGNHPEASRSRTNGWLLVLTGNDGATLRGTNCLYWAVGGAATGQSVRIELSLDDGASWIVLATNRPAASQSLCGFDTTLYPPTGKGRWRITTETGPVASDMNDRVFSIKNGPLIYYVNDGNPDTSGDVYTQAPSQPANPLFDGLTPDRPLPSLEAVVGRYALGEGDLVLIDTGHYPMSKEIVMDLNVAGSATNPVVFQGSTNWGAGGTVLDAQNLGTAISLQNTAFLHFRSMAITNALAIFRLKDVSNCRFSEIRMRPSPLFTIQQRGVEALDSTGLRFENCLIHDVTGGDSAAVVFQALRVGFVSQSNVWRHGIMWNNRAGFRMGERTQLAASNSIFGAFSPGAVVWAMGGGSVSADYNNYYLTNGAIMGLSSLTLGPYRDGTVPIILEQLNDWRRFSTNDTRSLSHDPRFAGPGDWHLMSQGGRVQYGVTGLVFDTVSSDLIDAGDPATTATNEPAPNGRRVNIGLYGGSTEASRTATNPLLTAVTLHDGGWVKGTNAALYWVAHGAATGQSVRIEASTNGTTWTRIIEGIPAGVSTAVWNTTTYPNSLSAEWRVVSEIQPSVAGRVGKPFAVRNAPFTFYVNDASTNGDVYATAPGSTNHSGLSAGSPLPSLANVLSRYDLEAGDIIYVDTGTYSSEVNTVISQLDAGRDGVPVTVQGSTNGAAGGTRMVGAGLTIEGSLGLVLRHLNVELLGPMSTNTAVSLFQNRDTRLEWVRVANGGVHGFDVKSCSDIVFQNCSAHGFAGNGLTIAAVSNVVWRQGVLWSNRVAGANVSGLALSISNSVIGAFGAGAIALSVGGTLDADYNNIVVGAGALVAQEPLPPLEQQATGILFPIQYDSLTSYSLRSGRDRHSLTHDPLFAAPLLGDFHPRSETGRFVSASQSFVVDAVTSPLVDAGAPNDPVGLEREPNGGRLNIGLYGGSAEASKTPTNSALLAVSFNDGGVVAGTNLVLYWIARGGVTSHPLRVEVSVDGGASWLPVATNLAPGTTSVPWNTTTVASSLRALWRVRSETNPSLADSSDRLFALNPPFTYYVNDASTNADVYCSQPGNPGHTGTTAADPLPSLQDVLNRYDLNAGDLVLVDTGVYPGPQDVRVTQLDSGQGQGIPVTIRGSTNQAAGGSLFQHGLLLQQTSDLVIRDLRLEPAGIGIQVVDGLNCQFEQVHVSGGTRGAWVLLSAGTEFRGCSFRGGATDQSIRFLNGGDGTLLDHCVFWAQSGAALRLGGGSAFLSNSVIGALGAGQYAYVIDSPEVVFTADYNNLFLTNGARAATILFAGDEPFPRIYENVSRWKLASNQDRYSLSTNPEFANPDAGDFHLRSTAGRYVPASGNFANDTVTSALIDAGAPTAAYDREIPPNGGRVNIGLHGNTPQASLSPSNGSLVAIDLNDGGYAAGSAWPLRWIARGAATSHTVRLEISTNGGGAWSVLATNVPAQADVFFWNTTTFPSLPRCLWRVVSASNPGIVGQTEKYFAIRNQPIAFYVNDFSRTNDVYTSEVGRSTNDGDVPGSPLRSVQEVLDRYDLEPGDTVYVDAGSYFMEQPVVIDRFDAWEDFGRPELAALPANRVTIQGSTSTVFRSELRAGGGVGGILLDNAWGVALRHLTVENLEQGQGVGVLLRGALSAWVEWVRSLNGATGIDVEKSDGVVFRHCVVSGNAGAGLRVLDSKDAVWEHGVFWKNLYGTYLAGVEVPNASLYVQNSVLAAEGLGSFGHYRINGALLSDYNVFHVLSNGFPAAVAASPFTNSFPLPFVTLSQWSDRTGQDRRSGEFDPLMVAPNDGDFHPLSPLGYFKQTGTGVTYVVDYLAPVSPLIDLGNPVSPFQLEPPPNGGVADIGLYGNTPEASASPGDGLLCLTFNNGGRATGVVALVWRAFGDAVNHDVKLEYSPNGGVTWLLIAGSVPASSGVHLWNGDLFPRSLVAKWRVTSLQNPLIGDENDGYFQKPGEEGYILYYVNDSSTNGDVYTTSPGSPNYNGLLPQTPKDSLRNLLDTASLLPGDIILIDTGVYPLSADVVLGSKDRGDPGRPLLIQGSTNWAAGGTVFDRLTRTGAALELNKAPFVELRDLTVKNALDGVRLVQSEGARLVRVSSLDNRRTGLVVDSSPAVTAEQLILFNNDSIGVSLSGGSAGTAELHAQHSIVWGSPFAVDLGNAGNLVISNSVLESSAPTGRVYRVGTSGGDVFADYNNYVRRQGAFLYERFRLSGGSEIYARLLDWQRGRGQDLRSLAHEPLFVDALNADFHPRSATGRFRNDGVFTNDLPGVYSPMLDTGDPTVVVTNEPPPHGGRVNIGRFGNDPQASLSQTSAWLLAISVNDGGCLRGTQTLHWAFGGMSTSETVRIEYARDGVDFDTKIATNVPVRTGIDGLVWDLSAEPPTAFGRWLVRLESNTNLFDAVDQVFCVKNAPLILYVNDANTNGDVYAEAPGQFGNDGLSPQAPLDSPATALQRYVLDPDDIVYIDTGMYTVTDAVGMVIGTFGDSFEFGASNQPIRIVGSTNRTRGFVGSVIQGSGAHGAGLLLRDTRYVEVENLRFTGASNDGIRVENCQDVVIRSVECTGNRTNGLHVVSSPGTRIVGSALWANGRWGLSAVGARTSVEMVHTVVASNGQGAVLSSGGVLPTNCILHAAGPGRFIYRKVGEEGSIRGDYNVFWASEGAQLAFDELRQIAIGNLSLWHELTRDRQGGALLGSEIHSLAIDPLFADLSAGDFHLQSAAGRFDPATAGFTNDLGATSWAIDAGNLTAPYDAELPPNGDRANAGRYGNTPEASKSLASGTNRALFAVSMRDGGQTRGDPLLLYWLSRGLTTNDRVTLSFSRDAGATWSVVSSNVPAVSDGFVWFATNVPPTPLAQWCVRLDSDPAVQDCTPPWSLRPKPITYYVNDASTNSDMYTTAVGSSTNVGVSSNAPMDSLQRVLSTYDLDGGDQVLVDSGVYVITNAITLNAADSGSIDVVPSLNGEPMLSTQRVAIVGATNRMVGGATIIQVQTNRPYFSEDPQVGIDFQPLSAWIDLSHMTIQGADIGVRLDDQSSGINLRNLLIRDGGAAGILFVGRNEATVERTVIARNQGVGLSVGRGTITLESSVVWSNLQDAVVAGQGSLYLSNSVLSASSENAYCLNISDKVQVFADYNNYFVTNHGSYVLLNEVGIDGLPQWGRVLTQDLRSISVDPLFFDAGRDDYHLLSAGGRYDEAIGAHVATDTVYSTLIDAGATNAAWELEPPPNGGQRNIGLYGNTRQASKSREVPWLLALTASSGGRLAGAFALHWEFSDLIDSTNTVRLEYSFDNGVTYIPIPEADTLPITRRSFLWDSLAMPEASSPVSRWRVVLTSNTNLLDQTDSFFSLNGPFDFFLNDDSTSNDCYAAGPGDDGNLGISAAEPMRTLKALLDLWDLDGGDRVLINAGIYPIGSNDVTALTRADQGRALAPVILQGCTGGVSRFVWSGLPPGGGDLFTAEADFLELRDLAFEGGGFGLRGSTSSVLRVQVTNGSMVMEGTNMVAQMGSLSNGLFKIAGVNGMGEGLNLVDSRVELSGVGHTLRNALVTGQGSPRVLLQGVNVSMVNNTVVSAGTAVQQRGPTSTSTLRNNILIASGSPSADAFCILVSDGLIDSDYNNLVARNGAWIGSAKGFWENLLYWQRQSGQDRRSIAIEPMFANEGSGDYHLRSEAGRWTASGFVQDATHSPSIDTGDPLTLIQAEQPPNGFRANQGAYGTTEQASKSRVVPWILAASMNDGGVLKGLANIRWFFSELISPTETIALQYSANNGSTWTTVVSGVSIGDREMPWDTTLVPDSFEARYRIVLESNPSVYGETARYFELRNHPAFFYVNDIRRLTDRYTTAAGVPYAGRPDGLSPGRPVQQVSEILNNYDLEAGDTVLVDGGSYTLANSIRLLWSDGGDQDGYVWIQGSTNPAAPTVLTPANTNVVAALLRGSRVGMRHVEIHGGDVGVVSTGNVDIVLERLMVSSARQGVRLRGTSNVVVRNVRLWNNTGGGIDVESANQTRVDHATFVNNVPHGYRIMATLNDTLQNSIFYLGQSSTGQVSALAGGAGDLADAFIDYNVYYLAPEANNVSIYDTFTDLVAWQRSFGKDFRSHVTDPLFANLSAGDFHVKSSAGRFDPALNIFVTSDTQTSWAVDSGNVASPFSLELQPNGARANIGAFGNTEQASKGRTNIVMGLRTASDPLPLNAELSPYPVVWKILNLPGGCTTVCVQYSGDDGDTWVNLQCGIPADQEYILWTLDPNYNTYNKGRLRVVFEQGGSCTNLADVSDGRIDLFLGTFRITSVTRLDGLSRIIWRGAWDEFYQVQYSDDSAKTWVNAISGPNPGQSAAFLSMLGGNFAYQDITSSPVRFRLYRVIMNPTSAHGDHRITNMYPSSTNLVSIVWDAFAFHAYLVEFTADQGASWQAGPTGVGSNRAPTRSATGSGPLIYEDIGAPTSTSRYYRVLSTP